MSSPSQGFTIREIHSLSQSEAARIIEQIARIEKRTFPSSEAFEFDISLWRKRPNTRVLYGTLPVASTEEKEKSNSDVIVAYAVYMRLKGSASLHKICVAQPYRGRGFGKLLLEGIEQRLRDEKCQSIQLWVDQDRMAARKLYSTRGFQERELVADYYGPGRTGIKMVLDIDRTGG